jgi:hypothetical protein
MADIPVVIIFVLFIIGAILAFKIIKSVLKALSLVVLVGVILIAAASFFIYKDAADFRQNWQDSDKLVLLEYNGDIEAAIQTTFTGDEPLLFDDDGLAEINTAYTNGELDKVKGDNYKILIIKLEPMLAEIESEGIPMGGSIGSISKEDAGAIITADDALDEIGKFSAEHGDVGFSGNLGNSEAKSAVAALLIRQLAEEKGSMFGAYLIKGYKSGDIIIYPETALFRLIKFLPDFIIERITGFSQKEGGNNGNI